MTYVLGINLSHDRSACLVEDGNLVVAVEEERLDRIKHSEGFNVQGHFERLTKTLPMKSITYCLETAGIGLDDLALVVGNRPLGDQAVERIARELPLKDKSRIRALPMPSHHLAHAYAAFAASPFDDAAVLVVDAVGSRLPGTDLIEKHSFFVGEGTDVRRAAFATYPTDLSDMGLGLFYNFFTAKLRFTTRWGSPSFGDFQCGGYPEAGKTMGLAPYGQPRPDWDRLLRFEGHDVRVSLSELQDRWQRWLASDGYDYYPDARDSWDSPFAKDVARKAQDELESAMLFLAEQLLSMTGKRRLCLSGGVALNSVANQRIAAESGFDDLYILPPAGDAGVSIGCALYGYHVLLGNPQRRPLESAATGRSYDEADVHAALAGAMDYVEWHKTEPSDVARLIADHYVVGWVQGGSEMGPRALGQRSILADPRHPHMRDYLNRIVKHREVFRPYAPSVLFEHANNWFALTHDSPYMLLVPDVLPDRRVSVPSITHVDGTARVQTVSERTNPRYHELISAFHLLTGVPLVLNTSFNDAGEPIVETPAQAIRTFLRTEMDYLYINNVLIRKRNRVLPTQHPARAPLARLIASAG
jgi:carbamoyltransferase